MNDVERDQWLNVLGDIESADELLKHHATLEVYLKGLTTQAANVRRVLKIVEKFASEAALGDGQTNAAYTHGDVVLKEKTIFSVNDWEKFYAWIAEAPMDRMTGFLHKREGSTAIGKYLKDQGELPPGCEERLFTEADVKSRLPENDQ